MSCKSFTVKELVSPEVYEILGEASWRLIPQTVCDSLDGIRKAFGMPITVNNWGIGGMLRYCGIRPVSCREGAVNSTHKLTKDNTWAFDLHSSDLDKLESVIKEKCDDLRICRMENRKFTPTWIHIEVESVKKSIGLKVFNP